MQLPIDYTKAHWTVRKQARQLYIKQQNGLCYFCNNPLSEPPTKEVLNKRVNASLFPSGFFNYPVHLHHSHQTGLTIGAVHCYCNAVLWQHHGE